MIRKIALALAAAIFAAASCFAQTKLVDSFDSYCWKPTFGASKSSPEARIEHSISKIDKIEGEGCLRLEYDFAGKGGTEYVYAKRMFANFRSDFSFFPKSLSLWVKGDPSNEGQLRVVLLQGDMRSVDYRTVLQTYQYTDSKAVKSSEWTRIEIPFESFRPLSAGDVPLDLCQVNGYRIDIVNTDGRASEGNVVLIDRLEQHTNYKPVLNRNARFSSLFIQLNKSYVGTDWEQVFESGKEIGIETWIVQFCIGRKTGWNTSFYKNCSLPWITEKLDIVDRMFAAAQKCGVKFIIGSSYQSWTVRQLSNTEHYDEVFETNRLVIEDVARNFASSPLFAGWYIANEFHDGVNFSPNWYDEECNSCLAAYLEKTAKYMKSFKDVPVCVAPALFRGRPARLTGDMYDRLFAAAPSIDRLYLQDCAGRGGDMVTSVTVDLPNYFAEVKKACDRNGVTFGVDIESFFRCDLLKQPRRPKTWEELQLQLETAGSFTSEITNFSWFSFQPGQQTWEGYRKYIGR